MKLKPYVDMLLDKVEECDSRQELRNNFFGILDMLVRERNLEFSRGAAIIPKREEPMPARRSR